MAEKKAIILKMLQILQEETDKNHILNATTLAERLDCNRKTVYANVEALREFGVCIGQVKGSNPGYYLEGREFELPELKLLVDAVQASRFITKEWSDKLIHKLEKMTNHDNASQLQRHVVTINRVKAGNNAIFHNVDLIHSAMIQGNRIRFQYCEWSVEKTLVPRRGGQLYDVSPWSLAWAEENYYLVAFDEQDQKIKHYRVDKIQNVETIPKSRSGRSEFEYFNLANYAKKTFGMYGGRDAYITFSGENRLVGVILDRFGTDVFLRQDDKDPERFRASATVAVSPQFFGWVTGIGRGLRIESPQRVQEEYKEYLKNVMKGYEQ